jgi:neopullulanase
LKDAPVGRIADVLRHDALYPRPDDLATFFGNHDVARLASEEGSSAAKLKLAFALALTLRGIPELYYGDEIGMRGAGDPDNRRDFPGGWREDKQNAFSEQGRTREQQDLFCYVKELLRLRREHAALRGGHLWDLFSDETSYIFARESEEERLLVVFNNNSKPRELDVALRDTPLQGVVSANRLFGDASAKRSGMQLHIDEPPQSLSIFVLN